MFVNRVSKHLKNILYIKRAFSNELFTKISSEYSQLQKLINEVNNKNISYYKQYKWNILFIFRRLKQTYSDFEGISFNTILTKIESLSLGENIHENELLEESIEEFNKLKYEIIMNSISTSDDIFLELHAGSGGKESCDWCEMLYSMYNKFCKINHFKIMLIDYSIGIDSVGYKSMNLEIKGKNINSLLYFETGIHRLIRKSPYNPGRHTSFSSVLVYPKIKENKNDRINEKDIEIEPVKCRGNGGQSVNKTESGIRVIHKPSGITVRV